MTQEGWQLRLTRVVASQIRLYRALARMSAQDLSDRCEELGLPMPRAVLSNLENGRRESVSIAEVIVLARALEIAPLQLVMPVGRQEVIELLPGYERPIWDAARWFSGEIDQYDLDERERVPVPGFAGNVLPTAPLPAFRKHDELLLRWQVEADDALRHPRGTTNDVERQMIELRARHMRQLEADLSHLRRQMRRCELSPPPLPPELAHIDRRSPPQVRRVRN